MCLYHLADFAYSGDGVNSPDSAAHIRRSGLTETNTSANKLPYNPFPFLRLWFTFHERKDLPGPWTTSSRF